jgi:hypothetical protein
MRKDNKSIARIFQIILLFTFIIVLISFSNYFFNKNNIFETNSNQNKYNDNEMNYFIESDSNTENLTSKSINLHDGKLLYDDLIRNTQFTYDNWWSYTNSSNITAQWDSNEQNTWIHHYSSPTGTPKLFDQVASINQTLIKDFETPTTPFIKSTLFSEGFESGFFSTNGWNAQSGGGVLDITSPNSYNGSYCARFRGDSSSSHSTLTKTFNLTRYSNLSLSFYLAILIELEPPNDYLSVDIYDGSWHYQVRSYNGVHGYQLET